MLGGACRFSSPTLCLISDVDFPDLPSNPDKLVAGADYVPKARKKRRSSSGSASSATASSKKRSKKAKGQDPPIGMTNNHNSSGENHSMDSQLAPTNHERIPEVVVVKKVFVSYFESPSEERPGGVGARNDM